MMGRHGLMSASVWTQLARRCIPDLAEHVVGNAGDKPAVAGGDDAPDPFGVASIFRTASSVWLFHQISLPS